MNHKYPLYKTKEQALPKMFPKGIKKNINLIDSYLRALTRAEEKSDLEREEHMYTFYETITVISRDILWEMEGKKNIFIKDYSILDNLIDFQYSINESGSIDFNFKTFSVSIPEGYVIDNVEIPSFLVSTNSLREINEVESDLLSKYEPNNIDESELIVNNNSDELTITIQYFNENKKRHERFSTLESETFETLSSKSYEEFCSSGERQYFEDSMGIKEHKIMYYITRIVMGLMISNSATDGAIIKEGLPFDFTSKLKMKSIRSVQTERYFYDFNALSNNKIIESPDEHYRRWHFRNLKHDKYYQDANKKYKPGTRWTLVRDTVVNKTIEGHTCCAA